MLTCRWYRLDSDTCQTPLIPRIQEWDNSSARNYPFSSFFTVFEFQGRERPAPPSNFFRASREASSNGSRKVSNQIGFSTWRGFPPGDPKTYSFRFVDFFLRAEEEKRRKISIENIETSNSKAARRDLQKAIFSQSRPDQGRSSFIRNDKGLTDFANSYSSSVGINLEYCLRN